MGYETSFPDWKWLVSMALCTPANEPDYPASRNFDHVLGPLCLRIINQLLSQFLKVHPIWPHNGITHVSQFGPERSKGRVEDCGSRSKSDM